MAKVSGKNVTVDRDVIKGDKEYDAGNPQVFVQFADGSRRVVARTAVSDHVWKDGPAAGGKAPPVNPAYRNPHHPADHIPQEPDPNYKDPERRDIEEHPGETPEQTRARHQANPTTNANPNAGPIDPALRAKLDEQLHRDDKLGEKNYPVGSQGYSVGSQTDDGRQVAAAKAEADRKAVQTETAAEAKARRDREEAARRK